MSTSSVPCPKCFAAVATTTDKAGQAVVCPECRKVFLAPAAASPAAPPSAVAPPRPRGKAIPLGSSAAPIPLPTTSAEGNKPATVPTARRVPTSGPGERRRERPAPERPANRPRRRFDEDEDDRPKKGGSMLPLVLILSGVLVLILILGGVAAVVAVLANKEQQAKLREEDERRRADEAYSRAARNNPRFDDPWAKEPLDPWGPGGGPPGPGAGGAGPDGAAPGRPGDPWGPGGPPPGGAGPGPGRPGEPWNPQPQPKPPRPAPVYADITPVEIKPPALADDKSEVKLPDKVLDTCSGGGGRFLIAHVSGKKLAVFDVNQGKVVKYIALTSDTALIAAGMNKLIVAYPDQNTLARYDLTTFEKEASDPCPVEGTLKKIALGSASAGPLLLARSVKAQFGGTESRLTFADPYTFKAVDIEFENGNVSREWTEGTHLRASPDGTVFATHGGGGPLSIVVRGGSARWFSSNDAYGHVTPGPDGSLYTGYGLYTGEFKRVGRVPTTTTQLLPAAEGHLSLQLAGEGNGGFGPAVVDPKVRAEVRLTGDDRAVYSFKDIGPFSIDPFAANAGLPLDRRVHFTPSANLFVTLPSDNKTLVLRKFDLEKAFEASGVDYLYVTSRPPTAMPGKGYEYRIATKSKKGKVTYKADAGPDGLKVSDDGRVTWEVPADFAGVEPVIVTVADASGQEVYHTFELTAGDGKRFAGPISGSVKGRSGLDEAKGGVVPVPDRVFELKPPPLQAKAEVKLPGLVDAVCAGGGGRFVVYRLPGVKQLAVLDVVTGKVVKYLPLAEADALFAAGGTKLFVYLRTAAVLLRYDLETFDKELTAQNPLGGTPTVMLMGHSSDGPLFLGGGGVGKDGKGYGWVNARTLKEVGVPLDGGATGPAVSGQVGGGGAAGLAVSADGRTYCWQDNWSGSRVLTLGEKSGKVKSDNTGGVGVVVPGPDGTLYGASGLYTAEFKKLGDKKAVYGAFVPAASGPWYVSVVEGEWTQNGPIPRKVSVGLSSDESVRFPLDTLSGLPPVRDQFGGVPPGGGAILPKVPMANRLHLVPEAEVLAVLDDGMDKVYLHRLAVKPLLEKADKDYLMVVSRPPPAARGRKWTYTLEVWSKKGGVKVVLESGPEGMTADGGTVTWTVPDAFAADDAQVLLTVSDAGRQETFHAFAVAVRAGLDPAAAVIRPKVPAAVPKPGGEKKSEAVPAFPIKPTAAKDGTDVPLPAAADFACFAGGGRFVLLRVPSKKLLAVFDVNEGRVVKELPLAEEKALIAGGRGFAVVVNPVAGVVQRWNLSTFEKDATTKLPDAFAPTAAVMGHASAGPLLLGSTNNFTGTNGLYDPLTLKKIELKSADPNVGHSLPGDYSADTVHASADGRVFVWRNPNGYPTGAYAMALDGPLARTSIAHVSAGPVFAAGDGTVLTGAGVFSGDLKKILDGIDGLKLDLGQYTSVTPGRGAIPASDGPFYLWFPPLKGGGPGIDPKLDDGPPALKMIGVKEPLATLKDLRGLTEPKDDKDPAKPRPRPKVRETFPVHQRVFLVPQAELLAVLSPDGTKLLLHAFKPKDLLQKSGQDYLIAVGGPPPAVRGKTWTYSPEVWSNKGGVKVEVVKGPSGMTASGAAVVWDIPADLIDTTVAVEVKITDASGKSVTQTFTLTLTE